MGKRELVLISLFIVVGIAIYQFTAPPAPAGSDLSVGGLFQRMRRGMQGPRETASAGSQQVYPVATGVETLRLNLPRPCDLTITGSDRNDIAVDMKVVARGYDQGETRDAAAGAKLTVDPTGGATMTIGSAWNDRREGQRPFLSQVTLAITVPRRLQVILMPHVGLLTVKDVASLDASMSRGETHVTGTAGDVRLTHVGGALEVAGGATLKLSARNSRGDVSGFSAATSIDAIGSRLKLSGLSGVVEIESRNTDFEIEKIDHLKPPLRINVTASELRIDGLRVEARIDGRNSDIGVTMAAAAPLRIDNLGVVTVTAPPDGYTLDAIASEGRIRIDEPGITPSDGADSRASGKVRGGGPEMTLRTTRGRIEIRSAGK
jgi:hypothetical protein